jgi:acyl carrier protein
VNEPRDKIREFIREELLFEDPEASLSNETHLLDGVVDSLGLMQVVAFLEQEFAVAIEDNEITVDHFRTVNDIAELVSRKAAVRS